jgi:3-oxoacyl-(acyl-carrier-protein) synthase
MKGRSGTSFLDGHQVRNKRCPVARVDIDSVTTHPSGSTEPYPVGYDEYPNLWLADLALRQALGQAKTAVGALPDPTRVGLYLGSSATSSTYLTALYSEYYGGRRLPLPGVVRGMNSYVANAAGARHGITGPNRTFSSSCASSLQALYAAACDLERETVDAALVLGVDSCLSAPVLDSWMNLRALSQLTDPDTLCRPFCATRGGQVLGEAAVCLALQLSAPSGNGPVSRGTKSSMFGNLRLLSYSDGLDPQGLFEPSVEAMTACMAACVSGQDLSDLSFVHANAGGSRAGDLKEAKAIRNALPSLDPPVYASRALVGNVQGASGLLALAFSLLVLKHGRLPANPHIFEPDPEIASLIQCIYEARALTTDRKMAVVNTFGFGGVMNSLLFELTSA